MSIDAADNYLTPKRRWPWILTFGLIGSLGLAQLYRLAVHNQVRSELAAIRQEGFPVTCQELMASQSQIPDKENAALQILDAVDNLFVTPDAMNRLGWNRTDEMGPDDRDALRSLLTNNVTALEEIHEAVGKKRCRFPIDYTRGPETLLPHLAKIKSFCQLLKAEAALASEEGESDKAVRAVIASFELARCLDKEPLLISQLVRIACAAISCSTLERVLTQHALTDAQLQELAMSVKGVLDASRSAFQGGFVGEICLGTFCFTAPPAKLAAYTDNGNGNSDATIAQVAFPIYAWSGLRDRDFLFYLKSMHRTLKSASLPFPESVEQSRRTADELEASLSKNRLYILSRMLLPSLQRSMEKAAELEARMRGAQVALAIERFRLKNPATLPEHLNVLVPEFLASLPSDPMTGQALHFKKLDPGYVVYGVGANGKDDGGMERTSNNSGARRWGRGSKEDKGNAKPAKRNTTDYDVTFIVER